MVEIKRMKRTFWSKVRSNSILNAWWIFTSALNCLNFDSFIDYTINVLPLLLLLLLAPRQILQFQWILPCFVQLRSVLNLSWYFHLCEHRSLMRCWYAFKWLSYHSSSEKYSDVVVSNVRKCIHKLTHTFIFAMRCCVPSKKKFNPSLPPINCYLFACVQYQK